MNFNKFSNQIKQTPEELYTELFLQHQKQFSIRNQRIAVKKLQKIFEETFKLANEKGFQAMTLRQLATATKMSMGGLYAYIHSKEDLAQIIHSFLNHYCEERIEILLKGDFTAEQTLIKLIRVHLFLSELMQPWFYFAYMETKNLSKKQKSSAIQSELWMETKIQQAIEWGVAEGVFQKNENSLIAPMVKALLQDWYLKRWKYKKRKITVDDYAKQLEELVLVTLKSKIND